MESSIRTPGMSRSVARNSKVEDMADDLRESNSKVKVTSKGSQIMAQGYTDMETPKDMQKYPQQLASTRDNVGSRWMGPKGRVGSVHHGAASPSSKESFLRQAPGKEFKAK